MNKHKGNNSYPKHGLTGQNCGLPTREQLKQRGRDIGRVAQQSRCANPVQSSTVINYRPHSIVNDLGTTKSVLKLTRRNRFYKFVPAYWQLGNGQIVKNKI
jgi:hypothetical protein